MESNVETGNWSADGFPRLKIWLSAFPFGFSRIVMRPSIPSSMYVKQRRCEPPSTSLIGTP